MPDWSEQLGLVVQVHGEPGSGKSTLAQALGRRLDAVVLDKDVIKAALLRSGIIEGEAAAGAYEVYFAQAHALVDAGHAIVLDNPVFWPRVEERWLEVSRRAGSPAILIECVCPDRDELVRRLATRDGLESQPTAPLDLELYPGAASTAFRPRLTVDATRPVEDLADEAIAYIAAMQWEPLASMEAAR